MEILTVKVGDEIRSRDSLACDPPLAIVVDAGDGAVTIVLRTSDADLSSSMHNAARGERQQRLARRHVEQRRRTRLEKRQVS